MSASGGLAGAPRPATLTVTDPSGNSRNLPLENLPFTIGRHADNDVVIRDSRASRYHARITADGADYRLEDLGSTHGTLVNGERVESRQLADGDVISFGFQDSYQITFQVSQDDISRLLGQLPSVDAGDERGLGLTKLRAVIEVARALRSSLSIESVLDAVVDAALTVTGAQRGFLLLQESDDLGIRVARDCQGRRLPKNDLTVPTRLINRALHHRKDLLSMNFDPAAEQGLQPDMSVANLELRSVVCVPLVKVRTTALQETIHASLNETLGLLYLDSRQDVADLSSGNRELLQTLAIEASTVLENARLLDEERAKQKLEEELRVAREIQQSLLPKHLPTDGWFRAAGSSIASRQVGGDYFDAIRIREECWATVVADVCGKGVSSALLASLIQGAFLRGAESEDQIRAMLERMNLFLIERTEGEKYATLFYSVLSADGLLRWANAAHCSPVLVHAGGKLERLQPSGMPVGMLEAATYGVETTQLADGDKLIIYSDGFPEARNAAGEFFEEKRLLDLIREHEALDCTELQQTLLAALREFTGDAEQSDDITMLVVEYGR